MRLTVLLACIGLSLGGCVSRADLPAGQAAYDLMPPVSAKARPADYRIGPLDELTIRVFQEPDLEMKEAPVDAGGNIQMALIGRVHAEGLTTSELAQTITAKLGERYLIDPQVSVVVNRSVSQRVTVDGQVKKPGSYELEGRTSLVQAVAMAEGTTEIADTDEVYIFRMVDDRQYGAKFNLKAIRKGAQPDPEIFGQDVVVVGSSSLKGMYQDFLKVAPFLGTIFIATQQN